VETAETRISGRTIYTGRVFDVVVDRVALPDGVEAEREIVSHPGSVVLVPLDGQDILLVQQFRYALGRNLLELPAGTLKPTEDIAVAAQRELQEETGFASRSLSPLLKAYPSPGYTNEKMHFFLATDLYPAPLAQDADERIEVQRLPIAEAISAALAGTFEDLKTAVGILLLAARLDAK
jgi:ADP-ribose pyrophosphatase